MKLVTLIVCLALTSLSFASEVETECPAMNQSREKNLKLVKTKTSKTKAASVQ